LIQDVDARVRTPAVPAVRAFPVSVKGVAVRDGQLLLENERAEWELPVGKLGEHKQVGLFTPIEVPGLPIPRGARARSPTGSPGWVAPARSCRDWPSHTDDCPVLGTRLVTRVDRSEAGSHHSATEAGPVRLDAYLPFPPPTASRQAKACRARGAELANMHMLMYVHVDASAADSHRR
jgi:hypothetical protein